MYNFLGMDQSHPTYHLLWNACDHALELGYSVIDIKGFLGFDKAKSVYAWLRDVGLLIPMKEGRPKKLKSSIPSSLELSLDYVDIGFQPWCRGRRPVLDAELVAKALNEKYPSCCPEAHVAFYRDFPRVYRSIYDSALPVDCCETAAIGPFMLAFEQLGISSYQASCEETKFIVNCSSMNDAFVKMENMVRIENALKQMWLLPDRRQ
jgi:hypothetical protein